MKVQLELRPGPGETSHRSIGERSRSSARLTFQKRSQAAPEAFTEDLAEHRCELARRARHERLTVHLEQRLVAAHAAGLAAREDYGLSIVFSDGHGTGIYRFDFLRDIDPARRPAEPV